MWWIIIAVIAILIFSKYSNDRTRLKNTLVLTGGMTELFKDFLDKMNDDFGGYKILKVTETELELEASYGDNRICIFGIKVGFSSIVHYRWDTKVSTYLNADIAVEGNIKNQIACYNRVMEEIIRTGRLKQ